MSSRHAPTMAAEPVVSLDDFLAGRHRRDRALIAGHFDALRAQGDLTDHPDRDRPASAWLEILSLAEAQPARRPAR